MPHLSVSTILKPKAVLLLLAALTLTALTIVESRPEPIESVISEACAVTPLGSVTVLNRKWHRFSFAVQGLFYVDSGRVKLSIEDVARIKSSIATNGYIKKMSFDGKPYYELSVEGDRLCVCSIDEVGGHIEYDYSQW